MELIKFNCKKPDAEVKFKTELRRYSNGNRLILVPAIFDYLVGCEVEVTIKKVSGKVVK